MIDRAVADVPLLKAERDYLLESGGDPATLSNITFQLADLDIAQEKWGDITGWLEHAIGRGDLTGRDRPRPQYWLAQASFENNRDDPGASKRAKQILRELIEDPDTGLLLRAQCIQRLTRIALHWDQLEEAQTLWIELDLLAPESSFAPDERAHRAVLELQIARRVNTDIDESRARLLYAWKDLLSMWKHAPPRPGGIGFLTYKNHQRILAEVLRVVLERDGPEAAFDELYAVDLAGTLSKVLGITGGESFRTEIGPDEILLSYQPTLEGTHLFVVIDRGVSHHYLPFSVSDLEVATAAFHNLLRTSPSASEATDVRLEQLGARGAELWAGLIPDAIRATLGTKSQLTIHGADRLQRLAFECIGPTPQTTLGLSHDVAYLPSLPLRSRLKPKVSYRDQFTLRSGASAFVLPQAWDIGLTKWYGQDSSKLHASTRAPFAQSDAAVLQLFGHGRLDFTRELVAAIDLDREQVGYQEIIDLEHPPQLALLTACGSWRGFDRPGDGGAGHLASAFFRRGTQTVVLPAADIEAGASLAWSQVFHWHLSQGLSPAASARKARQALAASWEYADPFYYGLLHVVGMGHTPVFQPSARWDSQTEPAPAREQMPRWRTLLAGAGALLLLAIGWRTRARLSPSESRRVELQEP